MTNIMEILHCVLQGWSGNPVRSGNPFFQLNNETVVQLKTCSGWLHSHTTSSDTEDNTLSFLVSLVMKCFFYLWLGTCTVIPTTNGKFNFGMTNSLSQQQDSLLQCGHDVMAGATLKSLKFSLQ